MEFEHLRFESTLQAFRLRFIVAVAASALRTYGSGLVEQGAVGLATVLPAAGGVDD